MYIQLIVSSFLILPVSISVFVTDPTASTCMDMFFSGFNKRIDCTSSFAGTGLLELTYLSKDRVSNFV